MIKVNEKHSFGTRRAYAIQSTYHLTQSQVIDYFCYVILPRLGGVVGSVLDS